MLLLFKEIVKQRYKAATLSVAEVNTGNLPKEIVKGAKSSCAIVGSTTYSTTKEGDWMLVYTNVVRTTVVHNRDSMLLPCLIPRSA